MIFRTLGRPLLMLAGAAGLTLGLTSCSADHTVAYIYVLGANSASEPTGEISIFGEDNNAGNLTTINNVPTVTSGGQNPLRAVVASGNRFMYVLNAGTPSSTDTSQPLTYTSANIQLFSIGGYGQLSQQLSYNSQGLGSTRLAIDGSGAHLFVLDTYANVSVTAGGVAPTAVPGINNNNGTYSAPAGYPCQDLNNSAVFHPTGSITVFSIDGSTGRLQLQLNQRQQNLTYFPVGCFPVDFRLSASFLYTMDAGSPSNNDVQSLYTYAVASGTGQLTPAQTTITPVNPNPTPGTPAPNITALTGDGNPSLGYGATKYLYALDKSSSQIYAFSIAASGAPTAVIDSPYTDLSGANNQNAPSQTGGPTQTVTDSTGKYLYVTDGGPTNANNVASDIGGYVLNPTTGDLNSPIQTDGFTLGTVSGPVCVFEDPSNQYIYVAGSLDNSITGRKINPGNGLLSTLTGKRATVPTVQTPTWCLGIPTAQ